jgi:hypothetical protein
MRSVATAHLRSSGRKNLLHRRDMQKLLTMLGMTVGGYLGWLVGAPVGIFTAFIVSIVGTAAGVYAARRFAQRYLP